MEDPTKELRGYRLYKPMKREGYLIQQEKPWRGFAKAYWIKFSCRLFPEQIWRVICWSPPYSLSAKAGRCCLRYLPLDRFYPTNCHHQSPHSIAMTLFRAEKSVSAWIFGRGQSKLKPFWHINFWWGYSMCYPAGGCIRRYPVYHYHPPRFPPISKLRIHFLHAKRMSSSDLKNAGMQLQISQGEDESQLKTEVATLVDNKWKLDQDHMGIQKTFNSPTYAKALASLFKL